MSSSLFLRVRTGTQITSACLQSLKPLYRDRVSSQEITDQNNDQYPVVKSLYKKLYPKTIKDSLLICLIQKLSKRNNSEEGLNRFEVAGKKTHKFEDW